jgi:hypothetical protein
VKPFNKLSPYYNLFSGLSYNPNPKLNFKFNLATGVRVANLAELSSNGLHEGVFTYEIGNPNLKNEQIYYSKNSIVEKISKKNNEVCNVNIFVCAAFSDTTSHQFENIV